MIRFCNEEILKLKEEAKQLAQSVKDKVIKVARNLEQLRKNLLCIVYSEKDNDKKIEQFRKFVPKDMDVIKRAYDLIRKRERLNEEKRSYEKMADKIERNQAIAYLEYDIAKDKVEPEDTEKVSEERYKIRSEMNKQARVELTDIYGKEFDAELFDVTMKEMDELLEGKVAARAEKEN